MRKLAFMTLLSMMLTLTINTEAQSPRSKKDKRTPFDKVLYKNDHPYVEVNQEWVKLLSVDDIPIERLLEMAVDFNPTDWKLGFHRYWHYLMDELEITRGENVKVDYEWQGEKHTKDFPLLSENRDLATTFHEKILSQNRITRTHQKELGPEYTYLTQRIDGVLPEHKDWLRPAELIHDLEYLEWCIEEYYSYKDLTGFDYRQALDAIRAKIGTGMTKRDFAYQLKMLMANFGDGHSRVSFREVLQKEDRSTLPFKMIFHEQKFYAVDPVKKSFYQTDFPQIVAINDIAIETYFELAKAMVAKTTPKFVDKNAMSYLRYINLFLKRLGHKPTKKVKVSFSNGEAKQQAFFQLEHHRLPSLMKRYKLKDSILDNNIAYLAFNYKMYDEEEFIAQLHQAMERFKSTKGLIIDIRGNSGGDRAPLRALLPYFIREAKVVNVARYRIDEKKEKPAKHGYLSARYMLPEKIQAEANATEKEKQVLQEFKETVAAFKTNFKPSKTVSDERFTDYHYMVIRPDEQEQVYYYAQPVIVLVDEGCFSAADIFAAGMKQGEKVKLLGNTTGGGSGFSKGRYLPNSQLKVKLSRMFSYQADGNLYDGHGVVPDIPVDYSLKDKLGQTDQQLHRAIKWLQENP